MQPFDTELEQYKTQISKIKTENTLNYEYQYWKKIPNGMELDTERNNKYGVSRSGYEQWKSEEPQGWLASYGGEVSLREVHDRDNSNEVVGYITETKISDTSWKTEVEDLVDKSFTRLCELLDVTDIDTFKYFIYNDISDADDYSWVLENSWVLEEKIEKINWVYQEYCENTDYQNLIDKIKS